MRETSTFVAHATTRICRIAQNQDRIGWYNMTECGISNYGMNYSKPTIAPPDPIAEQTSERVAL